MKIVIISRCANAAKDLINALLVNIFSARIAPFYTLEYSQALVQF